MLYIGLDIGTSSLKTTLINEEKAILHESSIRYDVYEEVEGIREIDPEIWFQAVLQGLHEIFTAFDDLEVSKIGVSGQMHTTIFLDNEGKSVRKAIMWNDLRSKSMVAKLKEELSMMEETKYIASILSTGSPAMNAIWMKKEEPELFARVAKIMTAYDYIVYRLTGNYSVDYCDASTSALYDIVDKKWSPYMLEKLGIDESCLGEVHGSCDVVGCLKPSIMKKLSITNAIEVIAGTGDNPASAVAMGILKQNSPVISLGTSGVIIMPKKDRDFEGLGKNVLFSADAKNFVNVKQGSVRSAGGTHKWWVENIIESDDMYIDQEDIQKEELGDNKVLFFPHITGDKLIYQDMDVRGAFIGLSPHTQRKHMTQAVFEGVSFALKEVMENMKLGKSEKRMLINGGGSKSALWMNIMANILDSELEVVSMKATPGYGVCLLARMADGRDDGDVEEVQGTIYTPQKNLVSAYEKQYQKYKRIYRALKEITQ